MATPRSVAFHTLGCKLNFSETSSMSKIFRQAGYEEVDFSESADYYIINTCSVTDQADKKCRKIIRKAQTQNPVAKIIVVGCYAQLKPEEIARIPGVSMVLGAREKFNLVQHVDKFEENQQFSIIHAGPVSEVNEFVPSYSIEDRTRSFLKVQDGCNYKCSFCTIPMARGKSRSASIDQIVETARKIIDLGTKEIVLTGVNIGDFGNGTSVREGANVRKLERFLDLIKELDTINKNIRFRISSIEPNLCSNEIIEFVASSNCFMPHFHMPLQSGDDEILMAMKRRYKRDLYENRVRKIKELMPHASIGVDVIVGFPGESHNHFTNTVHFIKDLPVSYLHCFTYSERSNTLAASMHEKVDLKERLERSTQLRNLSAKLKYAFYEQHKNQLRPVLFESGNQGGVIEGFTDNYIKVCSPYHENKVNNIEMIKLENLKPEGYVSN